MSLFVCLLSYSSFHKWPGLLRTGKSFPLLYAVDPLSTEISKLITAVACYDTVECFLLEIFLTYKYVSHRETSQ